MLNTGFEVILKTFDRRGILLGIFIDDLPRIQLGNLCIRLVEHRANPRIQLINHILRQFVANVPQLMKGAPLSFALKGSIRRLP